MRLPFCFFFFLFNDTATTEIYTLSLHDALPICARRASPQLADGRGRRTSTCVTPRSEEHTSELQSPPEIVCRLLLEKNKIRSDYGQIRDKTMPLHGAEADSSGG